jgi:signal peptide peptidase SppA
MNERTADLSQYFGLWSIEPSRGQQLAQSLRSMDWNAHFAASEKKLDAQMLDGQARPYRVQQNVAVINIRGVMTKGGSSLSEDGSTIRLRQQIRNAVRDDIVSAIVLVIDSPGGTVAGTADLADEVRKANAVKPVISFVEDLAASAAYYVASQASEIHANQPDALIGSIGTYMVVYDLSGAFEKEGIKTHVIATGSLKGAGTMGSEITEEQLANWQSIVDNSGKAFTSAVQAGRKLTNEQLTAVTTGGVWNAADAKAKQLIDAISSFDEVMSRAASAGTKRKGRTMSAENNEGPKSATLQELETALPSASAEFTLRQLKRGSTVAQAKEAFLDERKVELDQRDTALKAKEDAVAKREKDVEAKETSLKGKGTGSGLKVLRDPEPNASGDDNQANGDGTAKAEFDALVAQED